MFKFFWGKGSQQSTERLKIQKELFQFQKTIQHGFPSKPTALSWDPVLRLLCLSTRSGALKIFGAPGVEFYGQSPKEKVIRNLHFIPGRGRVVAICEDNSLQLWEISSDGSPTLKCIQAESLEGKLKKISACCVESNRENLLIGTENGNIYIMDLNKLEMTDSVIYLDIVMQNVTEDFKVNPGAVECIIEQPTSSDHILIGYTRGLLVLWNKKSLSADQTFVASQQLESASWYPSGQKFISAHNDGSYMVWNLEQTGDEDKLLKKEPVITLPYGPSSCKAITKIAWTQSGMEDAGITVFCGGMPRASYGDRFTISVVDGKKNHVTFDFSSKVIDFCLINEKSIDQAEALVVLAEEELVVVDLITDSWPTFSLPYLSSLHCSAITAQTSVTVTSRLYEKIKSYSCAPSSQISTRPWPINGGTSVTEEIEHNQRILLLTGHEDGSVRFWDATSASLFQISKFETSSCFASDDVDYTSDTDQAGTDEDDWPPFRKVGIFDPYSDDPRLAVKKLCLCPVTGLLTVAGTAGQVVVAEFSDTKTEKEIPVALVNIVSDRDNFVWKGHDKLSTRKGLLSFKPGFQPTSVLQLHPPAAATSLALHAEWLILAVGTAHGLTLYDIVHKKEIVAKCTLNPNDVTGTGDQPMSRRKSFKKSLRESFRRLRKGRSQRPTTSEPKCTPSSPISKHEDGMPQITAGPSVTSEIRSVERQIEARNIDDGMGSMVRCLLMAKTYIISQSSNSIPTLWAGTNSGAIYVFSLCVYSGNKRHTEPVTAQLAKEIQLKHRAPVVSIHIIDANYTPIDESLETSGKPISECFPPHRVVISSEEQFKVFTLPNLRPFGKYKLTAYTGCKVRRVAVVPFTARSDSSYKENCLVCLSNQGDFHILSLPDLRRQMNAQAIRKEDIHATSTVVLTHYGEAFYMLSSSELQRIALSARNCLQVKCKVSEIKSCTSAKVLELSEEQSEALEKPEVANASDVSFAVNSVNNREDRENICNSEINNSTIVSVEPETSFGDLTMDSVKDHIAISTVSLDECRLTDASPDKETLIEEIKKETSISRPAESVALVCTTETSSLPMLDALTAASSILHHASEDITSDSKDASTLTDNQSSSASDSDPSKCVVEKE